MAGTLSRADLRADLKASLHDTASVFSDPADLDRFLDAAADHLGRVRPRTLAATLSLVADVGEYAAPAELLRFKAHSWGVGYAAKPWETNYPGRLPRVTEEGGLLLLTPAPTAQQIALLGVTFRFFYFAGYAVADNAVDTTVPSGWRGLLLLRAQTEACRELAIRGAAKPVSLRDGISNGPRNVTPAALYEKLMAEFLERAAK